MADLSLKRIASALGVLLALAFPFVDMRRLEETLNISDEIESIAAKLVVTGTLAFIGFTIRKRSLSFFQLRRFGLTDVVWTVIAIGAAYFLVALASPLVGYTDDIPGTSDAAETPLALALAGVLAAGVFEEFIYRGFLIEELGELLHNRWLAGAISVVFFALAHGNSHYGWSASLVLPGLVGLVITILYFWRSNLPICVLMHTSMDLIYTLAHRS
jgi:membrane protease YdiL (CAAX protease family)